MKRSKAYAFINAVKNVRKIIDDDVAMKNIALFPDWEIGKALNTGDRVEYNGKLYKVVQSHTPQETWTPDITPALYEPLDVVNAGTLENPIIAASGMTYNKDKYYLDETDGKIYLCTRDDTGNGTVLHYTPSGLVGVYFELVN